MSKIPARVEQRLVAGLKRFQPIIDQARARDVNEADTVTIVKDLLAELFGYDKYSEVTSEHAIRGTYCDLAIKIEGQLAFLIEVKAVGLELKDQFVKQAVDYAANQGVEWVVLTTGAVWRIYRVIFGQPIQNELVVEIRLPELNTRNDEHLELLWLLAKEGWQKARLGEFHAQRQAVSRFLLAALLTSEPMLDVIRRELRKMHEGIKITNDQISEALQHEVFKRETLDGDKAAEARKAVAKAQKKANGVPAPKKVTVTEAVPVLPTIMLDDKDSQA